MICFEVYRNGQKLCTAGIGDFGVLTAILTWVSHRPEKLARWQELGITELVSMDMSMSVGGLDSTSGRENEHIDWIREAVTIGDEIVLRIIDAPVADTGKIRRLPAHR